MHISDFIYNINNLMVRTYVYVTKGWLNKNIYMKKKKDEVAIIRMYTAKPISNLAISDQGIGLNWKWFKVDKEGVHSLCKMMRLYAFWTCLSFLIVKLHSFLPMDVKKNHIKIQIMTR